MVVMLLNLSGGAFGAEAHHKAVVAFVRAGHAKERVLVLVSLDVIAMFFLLYF